MDIQYLKNKLNTAFREKKNREIFLLYLLLIFYGLFSFPWPREIRWIEIIIGFGLFILVGWKGGITALGWRDKSANTILPIAIPIIFIYFLLIPLVTGILNHWSITDIVRDIIPLVYMFIPLLFWNKLTSDADYWRNKLVVILGTVGVIFSLRFFIDMQGTFDNLYYLPQSPEVLFGGIFWLSLGVFGKFKSILTWVYLCLGLMCYSAALLFGQRAEVAFMLLAIMIIFGLVGMQNKKFIASKFILMLGILLFLHIGIFNPQTNYLFTKTQETGINGKDTEFVEVINVVIRNNPIFGLGWGAIYHSPILNSEVSFTHSWLSYMLLKSGIIGVVLTVAYIFWLVYSAIKKLFKYRPSDQYLLPGLLASGAVLAHGIFFQTVYKTLGFGFVLLVLVLVRFPHEEIDYADNKPGDIKINL